MTDKKRIVRKADDLPVGHWLKRQLPKDASLRTYAEERAIITVLRGVNEAIENAGVNRAELAEVLGTSRPYVSQVLNGSTNATLKTLGALLWASGTEICGLQIEPLGTKRTRNNDIAFQLRVTTSTSEGVDGIPAVVRKAG